MTNDHLQRKRKMRRRCIQTSFLLISMCYASTISIVAGATSYSTRGNTMNPQNFLSPSGSSSRRRRQRTYFGDVNSEEVNSEAIHKLSSNKISRKPHLKIPVIAYPIVDWYQQHVVSNMKHLPKIQCRIEPTTTLKIRKTFRPFFEKTIVRLSANYNTQIGIWQFHSSVEDSVIGGKFTLAGRKELQFTKSWTLTGGSLGSGSNNNVGDTTSTTSGGGSSTTSPTNNIMDDMVTRLRLRAAVDLQTWKAYVRVGFRTEQRYSPLMMNVMEGFSIVKQIPLDGVNGKVKLEVKANFALPEPEIEYSTETHRSIVGMGDIEVGIEELNLLLDY